MNDQLNQLLLTLTKTVETYQQDLDQRMCDEAVRFHKSIDKITRDYAQKGASGPEKRRILAALEQLRSGNDQYFASGRNVRYLCWGLLEIDKTHRYPSLLEDRQHFSRFLHILGSLLHSGALSHQHLRGLLHAYFHFVDPLEPQGSAVGRNHWHSLRDYLAAALPQVHRRVKVARPWLDYLAEHPGLFGTDPTHEYLDQVSKNPDICNEIKEKLGLAETSWLLRELIYLPVTACCTQNDIEFKARIPGLLAYLKQHEIVIDRGLTAILTRHYHCKDNSAHSDLQQFALKQWGQPHYSQQLQWSRVDEEVRDMVRQWIVLEDLEDFFSLLQEERIGDQRRLVFWKKWISQITYSRIYLGDFCNNREDFRLMRQRKQGRFGHLLAGGSSMNNAIVMRLGDYAFVEFNITGNACFVYQWSQLPVDMREKNINLYELKDKRTCRHRLLHTSRWEDDFSRIIQELVGQPIKVSTKASSLSNPGQTTKSANANASSLEQDTMRFIRENNLEYRDLRADGGCLWVYHGLYKNGERTDPMISWQLRELGFYLKPGKGWWKK